MQEVTALTQLTSLPEFSSGKVVISFWASWSEPSRQMNQVAEQLQKQFLSVRFVKVEAEEVGDITEKYAVESVPAFVFLKNGEAVHTLKGANPPELTSFARSFCQDEQAKPAPVPVESLQDKLKRLIGSSKVVAFIKGTPTQPQCGFSRQFCAILNDQGIQYGSFNILSDQEVRDGLKKMVNWPTYPMLFINSELVGGLDVIKELAADGELLAMVDK